MITVKTKKEIETLREGGRRLAQILQKVAAAARPGISTWELDRLAESLILISGGRPSFKGHQSRSEKKPFPAALCTSLNDELVHGIPKQEIILETGDILGLDIGMQWPSQNFEGSSSRPTNERSPGLYTDTAVTIGIGKISKEAEFLLRVTEEALNIGIGVIRPGIKVGDISNAIQKYLDKNKLGIIRDLAGHGVGYGVHEDPLIPNFGEVGSGPELKERMVLAIEPMTTLGDWRIRLSLDGSTYKTADRSLGAHFEHTVVVTKNGVEVLTKL